VIYQKELDLQSSTWLGIDFVFQKASSNFLSANEEKKSFVLKPWGYSHKDPVLFLEPQIKRTLAAIGNLMEMGEHVVYWKLGTYSCKDLDSLLNGEFDFLRPTFKDIPKMWEGIKGPPQ